MTGDSGSQRTRDIIFGAIFTIFLLALGLGLGYWISTLNSEPEVLVLPTRISSPTSVVVAPTLTATPEGQPTQMPAAETPLIVAPTEAAATEIPTTPLPTLPPDAIVRFRAQTDGILAHAGPSDEVGVVGALTVNQEVLIAGRSADGVWWLVCCIAETPAWVKLENGNMLLISGDIGTVAVVQ